MKTCDACGKTTILPETIGDIILCKKCLIKINGVIWKYYNVEKGVNLDKYTSKSLELAKKSNFPVKVIDELEKYFSSKQADMKKCDVCGETKLTVEKMGKAIICKKCYSKLNIPEWKEDSFFDKQGLKESMNKVIAVAKKNNFPDSAIEYIEKKFNSKKSSDWLYMLKSDTGQTLDVYEKYMTLDTTDDFDDESMVEEYSKLIMTKDPVNKTKTVGGEILNDLSHLKNPLKPKNMVKTFANVAISNMNKEEKPKEKVDFYVRKGKRRIEYSEYDSLFVRMPRDEELYGFINIKNSNNVNSNTSNILFFFYNDDDEIKHVNKIISYIEKKIIDNQKHTDETNKINESASQQKNSYDDLRELKKLLDDGIINEDDYEKKKKQILGI